MASAAAEVVVEAVVVVEENLLHRGVQRWQRAGKAGVHRPLAESLAGHRSRTGENAAMSRPIQPPAPVPPQPRNPLHGLTLEGIVTALATHYGWAGLGERIPVRCFVTDPSVASSLKFLRKTPWAREKVESLYLFMLREQRRAGPPGSSIHPATNPPDDLPDKRPASGQA